MIAPFFWLAQIVAGPVRTPAADAATLPVPAVLQRYESALQKLKEPRVLSFDYTLEQTGLRTLSQTHRVFRSGTDERDETLTVDGKRLAPPKVRIFRGRRNRYTIAALSPRVQDYTFAYTGPRRDGHHVDYVFRLTPKAIRPFSVTEVTIDGLRFLPVSIAFETGQNEGQGRIDFGSNARWWVPYTATARAVVADDPATERLSFYTYRFPASLPPSAFGRARPALPAPPGEPVIVPLRPGAIPRYEPGALHRLTPHKVRRLPGTTLPS